MSDHEKQVRSARLEVNIEGTLMFRETSSTMRVMNISMGGIALETKCSLLEGDHVQVQFKLPRDTLVPVEFWGAVRNAGYGRVGVQYDEISRSDLARIEGFVRDCVLTQMKGVKECR